MNSVSPICCFRSNRILSVQPKHTTRCHRFHNRKNSLPLILCFFWSSSTQWILSSTSITFLSLLCAVTQGPNPFTTNSRRPFLEIDVKGGERDHIKAYHLERDHIREYHFHTGRERSPGGENTQVESISQGSQMLGVQEERCHMSSWGERHVHMCLFALALFIYIFQLWFSVPYLLPVSHARFRGSKTSKGKKSFKFIAYLYSWGHV